MRPAVALAACVFVVLPAAASDRPVTITAVHVGLPTAGPTDPGSARHLCRFGSWAPVEVELDVSAPVTEPAELVIESPDADEVTTRLAVPLDLTAARGAVSAADLGSLGYVRPAAAGEVTVTVRTRDGQPLAEPYRLRSLRPRNPSAYVVLFLGLPPIGFDLPKPAGGGDPSGRFRGGRLELTAITDPARLPDNWLGYDTADLVILQTGSGADAFLRAVFAADAPASGARKREALEEWVRRGGRLVIATGENAGLVGRLHGLQELLPVAVTGTRTATTVGLYWRGASGTVSGTLGGPGPFPLATLASRPDRPARILIPPPDRQGSRQEAVAAQAALGLGRVTLIGFDLDRPPFTDLPQRPEFWDWVVREAGAARAAVGNEKARPDPAAGVSEEEDEAAVALRTHADTFDDVPVITFGWVALLIGLYILLIGPVEYLFLKRVLGRLELTWVTFPLIVLTVSLAAYLTAYSLKGGELRVNKIDVLDVDPASGRAYGTTWLTVFSPRIETYTVAVTPGDGWGLEPAGGTAVSWVGGPRGGRASLMRRRYAYQGRPDAPADALTDVPVQVWSTKSFLAHWSGCFPPATAPVVSDLRHPPGDPGAVVGTFTSRLPVPVLSDCVVFYAGQAYPLPGGGTVRTNEQVRLVLLGGSPAHQWLQRESRLDELLRRAHVTGSGGGGRTGPLPLAASDRSLPLLGVLFHEAALTSAEGVYPRNASLRRLDQSWRLTAENRAEVILVGRAAPPPGPAEDTLHGPFAPSRVWLHGLPGAQPQPQPLPGLGRQETWVRLYLPVR